MSPTQATRIYRKLLHIAKEEQKNEGSASKNQTGSALGTNEFSFYDQGKKPQYSTEYIKPVIKTKNGAATGKPPKDTRQVNNASKAETASTNVTSVPSLPKLSFSDLLNKPPKPRKAPNLPDKVPEK